MKIEIISTGDEIVTGQILDTNAHWLCQFLFQQGLQVTRLNTVADNLDDLVTLFTEASQRADLVFVNGGLGPTSDDLSAAAAAKAQNVALTLRQPWLDAMHAKYRQRQRKMPESNRKQALLPEGANIIDNPVGTACGIEFRFNQAQFYFTPGVPHEFKTMLSQIIWPDIAARLSLPPSKKQYKLNTFGLAESGIDRFINSITIPDHIHLGYRTASPEIEVKLVGQPDQELALLNQQIEQALGQYVFSKDAMSPAEKIQQLLLARQQTLALAESCTGGGIAAKLVAQAGSSAILLAGAVTYSNQAKIDMVGVAPEQIEQYGAVSEQVAVAMAHGVRAQAGSDYGLAVTGIAGPGGGSDEKPVGTVVFALNCAQGTYVQRLLIQHPQRNKIQAIAEMVSLDMLRRLLDGWPVFAEYDFIHTLSHELIPG
ncbi:CinA family nicotinamide mononucleotide deamidase-related protein [Motilimonas pumila]|uniref:CinA-like protein n=1 Tax=Motilimonas pumila TaxID=2303987 RepID=A0A418YDD7_9GAMM|nr:CinA family nicotinamide mononucleotide deamidase-related protein [Motilimonas pumila]RJG42540.1 CinA family nicotinamide mononucleotide deamidase-related protein [Motilimonas pumila]